MNEETYQEYRGLQKEYRVIKGPWLEKVWETFFYTIILLQWTGSKRQEAGKEGKSCVFLNFTFKCIL